MERVRAHTRLEVPGMDVLYAVVALHIKLFQTREQAPNRN